MEDRCVCCGAIIPEGQMVCQTCMAEVNPKSKHAPPPERTGWLQKLLHFFGK